MPLAVHGDEWHINIWGMIPQYNEAFSLEEAPPCGRGSSLVAFIMQGRGRDDLTKTFSTRYQKIKASSFAFFIDIKSRCH